MTRNYQFTPEQRAMQKKKKKKKKKKKEKTSKDV